MNAQSPSPASDRLRLLHPPRVVVVRTRGGTARALLLARRGDRAYLQVHRGPGDEVLRWVSAQAVLTPLPAEGT